MHLFDNFPENSDASSSDNQFKSDTIFFPGTGSLDENTKTSDPIYPGGILNVPIKPGGATSQNWRQKFTTEVFERLIKFKPDFIFISAGFDAHENDHIHGDKDTTINEFDYEWLTENL